jgi:hypothetical protein
MTPSRNHRARSSATAQFELASGVHARELMITQDRRQREARIATRRVAAELLNDSFFKMSPAASFLVRVSAVRRGCARGSALPVFLSRLDHRQSDALGPAETKRKECGDHFPAAPDRGQLRQRMNPKEMDAQVSMAYHDPNCCPRAAAFSRTGSSISRSTPLFKTIAVLV